MSIRLDRLAYRINGLIGTIGCKLVVWSQRNGNYLKHARSEWAIAFPGDCEMQKQMGEHVVSMVAMFGIEGHSGFSAGYARAYIDKALGFEPFSPLTGDESEWGEPLEYNGTQQNKRCGHVFRDKDGASYDIEGRIFKEADGGCFTGKDSRVYISFPYTPTREYVEVNSAGEQS